MDKGNCGDLRENDSPPDGAFAAPVCRGEALLTIGELARAAGITPRALRFYQSKGLLKPARDGRTRLYDEAERQRLELVLQGKRLGFTLTEIRQMLRARDRGEGKSLPIGRGQCVAQIRHLERQRRDIDAALAELRQIYTGLYIASTAS